MKLLPCFLTALLLVSAVAGAQDFTVAYLEGEAQARSGTTWQDLAIGDKVPLEASVRVRELGLAQLRGNGIDIFLNQPGTYSLTEIVAARRQMSAPRVGAALANSFSYMAKGPTQRQSMIAGSRGASQSRSEDLAWVETMAEVYLESGRTFVESGQYDKAVDQFNQALDAADDIEVPEIRYNLANAYSLNGDLPEAWKQIAGIQPGPSAGWAGDFCLLKAKLLEDANAYTDALLWLKQDTRDLSRDAQRAPVYYFLLALGYLGSGDQQNAHDAFSKVVALSRDSDVGQAAKSFLGN